MVEGTRPLTGPALTNDLCSQNVKINVNVFISAKAKTALSLILTLILTLKY